MSSAEPALGVIQCGQVTIVEIEDAKLLDPMMIAKATNLVLHLIEQRHDPRILIDFSKVEQMSSSALGALVKISQRIQEKSGQLRLACLAGHLREILEITRLITLFQLFDSVEAALDSFT
jgi:anti-sigma B factor antagonist